MSDIQDKLKVAPDLLQYHFDASQLSETAFEDIDPCCEIIGQERALSAVEMGLEIQSKGYNIFVTGQPGTGRTTAVKLMLEGLENGNEVHLSDICYVNNFEAPDCPRVLYFPAGEGRRFKKAISYLVDSLATVVPKIFSGENYRERRQRIIKEFETRQKEQFREFEAKLKEKGFTMVQLQYGTAVRSDLQPIINNEAVSIADLEKLVADGQFSSEELERLKSEYEGLQKELQALSSHSRKISGDLEEELNRLDTSLVLPLVNDKIDTLKRLYDNERVLVYLSEIREVLIESLSVFRPEAGVPSEPEGLTQLRDFFGQFEVNLMVDNSRQERRPIVIEEFPSYKNLFGAIERMFSPATGWQSDFSLIRSGSILKANGGYLVINVADLFQDPHVWPMLKRTLRSGHLVISTVDPTYTAGSGLKPEPIEIDVKVVLIGERRVYDVLYRADEEFKKVFKIKAEFDSIMKNDVSGVAQYTQFIRKIAEEENLPTFDHSGLSAIVEYGVKLAGHKDQLSTRFTQVADLIREAAWLAGRNGRDAIDCETVKRAVTLQKQRVNLVETKVQEMYERDLYLIDVAGMKVGQINGLSVYDLGEYAFGRPSRITASLSPGADGVINIEREAAMSGRTHDKGVLILTGFMRQRFGRSRPLVFTASICFEQLYGGVDGDSASSTEVYALLSALSGKPINQALAVTGSVNQKGEIQPIGGVNEKIEGFFDVCMIDGLTGDQGVLIPIQNKPELMLKDEVAEAVKAGRFHVYAVSHVDEGIELLTGVPAGQVRDDGSFPEGTINYLADEKLGELAAIWRDYIASRIS